VTYLAITVLGHDRPGIIAQTAEVLAEAGMNLEDSSMTRLRGHFAMTLICRGDADVDQVSTALGPLETDGSLTVSVREIPGEPELVPTGQPYLMSVHGADRLGIVAQLAGVVADAGGNITDFTTRLAGDLYVLLAEVDLPTELAAAELQATLAEVAAGLGVEATLRSMERDEL
jgi:glycine cleavage system transcriptional repressor